MAPLNPTTGAPAPLRDPKSPSILLPPSWHKKLPAALCTPAVPDDAIAVCCHRSLVLGRRTTLSFTACDFDGLPVSRVLPRPGDPRRFDATLARASGNALPSASAEPAFDLEVEYVAGGLYYAHVTVLRGLGEFELRLELGGESILYGQPVNVSCADGQVALDDGLTCGCDAGEQANADPDAELPCSPCPAGQNKPLRGHARCEDCLPGSYAVGSARS